MQHNRHNQPEWKTVLARAILGALATTVIVGGTIAVVLAFYDDWKAATIVCLVVLVFPALVWSLENA